MNADETERMARAIADVARPSSGISIVLVEHDMAFVMGLADRVTVLDFGALHRRRHAGRGAAAIPTVIEAYLGGAAAPDDEPPGGEA